MKRIPKSFKVLGHTIKVIIVNVSEWKHPECVGYFDPEHSRIVIKRCRPASLMHHTFWHEVIHVILNAINHKLYADESFVDNMGGVLAQIVESSQ